MRIVEFIVHYQEFGNESTDPFNTKWNLYVASTDKQGTTRTSTISSVKPVAPPTTERLLNALVFFLENGADAERD